MQSVQITLRTLKTLGNIFRFNPLSYKYSRVILYKNRRSQELNGMRFNPLSYKYSRVIAGKVFFDENGKVVTFNPLSYKYSRVIWESITPRANK